MITRESYANTPLRSLFPRPSFRNRYSHWCDTFVRRERYAILSAFYDGTIYRDLGSQPIKEQLGLYKNIRQTYSILQRLVDFHVSYILGGKLGREAGPGNPEPTAIPIIPGKKASKNLAPAIAGLWACSKFARRKSMLTRYGAMTGDFGIELADDPDKGLIRERVMNPHEIRDAIFDHDGELTFISLEREILVDNESPRASVGVDQVFQTVIYREDITLDGGEVTYRTYRDDSPHGWPGTMGEKTEGQWTSRFPFIPIVMGQHIDVDFPFGASEIAAAIFKSTESDGQGSNLADATIRMVNGPWFLNGAKMSKSSIVGSRGEYLIHPGQQITAQDNTPSIGLIRNVNLGTRNDMSILECASAEAKMMPLMFPVPIAEVIQLVESFAKNGIDDFPELQADVATSSGDASGRALRVARQKAAAKIEERRMGYDELIVRAHKKALIMGGILGYDGYADFKGCTLESPEIEHHVGARSVFPADPMEIVEIRTAEATCLKTMVEAGIPLKAGMELLAWETDAIDTIMEEHEANYERDQKAEQKRLDAMIAQSEAAAAGTPAGTPAPDPNADPAADPAAQEGA